MVKDETARTLGVSTLQKRVLSPNFSVCLSVWTSWQ